MRFHSLFMHFTIADNIINLIGEFFDLSTPSMRITRLSNILILHPDILVSSTKVADTSSCARRALLQEIIRTSTTSTDGSTSLVYGNMLHEVLQKSLTDGQWSDEKRVERIEGIARAGVKELWTLGVGVAKAREELEEKSRGFEQLSEVYCGGTVPNVSA